MRPSSTLAPKGEAAGWHRTPDDKETRLLDTFRYGIVVPILNLEEVAGSDGVAPSDPRRVGPNQSIAVGPGRSIKPRSPAEK